MRFNYNIIPNAPLLSNIVSNPPVVGVSVYFFERRRMRICTETCTNISRPEIYVFLNLSTSIIIFYAIYKAKKIKVLIILTKLNF